MTIKVKICGITDRAALDAAIAGGARWAGFVFHAASPRAITPDHARALIDHASGRIGAVGLFVDRTVAEIGDAVARSGVSIVQLHGAEDAAGAVRVRDATGCQVWKALPIGDAGDVDQARAFVGVATRVVYDARPPAGSASTGGHGQPFDWAVLDGAAHPLSWMLSGGLTIANVAQAIARTGARAVDVSSGVERLKGQKDVDLIAAFLKAARSP